MTMSSDRSRNGGGLTKGKWSPLRVTQDELKAWTDPTVRGERK